MNGSIWSVRGENTLVAVLAAATDTGLPIQESIMETFEERQAYIDKCWLEIREAEAQSMRQKAIMDQFNLAMQAAWLEYSVNITTLIYRGMFDPTFCKPAETEGKQ